jgi:hypothetical protein
MTPATAPENPEVIARVGELLYGPYWVAPLAREIGVDVKVLLQVKHAARFGGTYPVGPGVMLKLRGLVRQRLAQLKQVDNLL